MATQQPEDGEAGKGGAPDATPTEISASGLSRRRFAKAGAGASAGVIMTLVSQPAMAATELCVSASGAASANLSFHSDHLVACSGLSPGYWKNHPASWQGALTSPTSQFNALFHATARTAALTPYTCMQVVTANAFPRANDPDNVAMHIMATLLNVRSGRIGFLTEINVIAIWNAYAANGTYQPTYGVTWNGAQIVSYLKKTMS